MQGVFDAGLLLQLWITAKGRELEPDGEHPRQDHRVENLLALLNEIGNALGRDDIPRSNPEERATLVRHALAGRRALLALDNLESFNPEERRRIFELLGSLPEDCRALVTTRQTSNRSTAAHHIRLDRLEREATDELLAELGEHWPPVSQLTADERDRLYKETGGNPLLLTWTAGQLGRTTGRCRTVDEAVARLHAAHQSNAPLGFIFGDLVEGFSADELTLLAALSHFTQPARLRWLVPMTGLSPTATETTLDGLRDRALLVEDFVARTWLLPPLATRYLQRVRPEVVTRCGERLVDRAFALVMENGFEKHDRFPALEAAWPEVAAALPLLLAGENDRLQRVCNALQGFLNFTGRWDERIALSEAAGLRAEAAGDAWNAGWRAYDAGWCHHLRGDGAALLACAERAAAHWQGPPAGARERAFAIRLRGHGHRVNKAWPEAIAALREALDLWRGLSPMGVDVAIGLNDLAGALRDSGDLDGAEPLFREALSIARELPYPEGVATCTGNLAELALDRERWPEAEALAREALGLAEPLRRKELIAAHCRHLAKALARQGRGGEGRCHAERAVAIYTELRSRDDLAEAQAVLAECQPR